jgi:hypothetical protein
MASGNPWGLPNILSPDLRVLNILLEAVCSFWLVNKVLRGQNNDTNLPVGFRLRLFIFVSFRDNNIKPFYE